MEDFVKELEWLSLAIRLKRISDRMMHSGKRMYKTLELDVEPNWYLILKLLDRHKELSVTEIADALQFSHPTVVTMVEKMTQRGYLTSAPCEKDSRRRLLTLTEKATTQMPDLQQVWNAGTRWIEELMEGYDPFPFLEKLENALHDKDFASRTLEELNERNAPQTPKSNGTASLDVPLDTFSQWLQQANQLVLDRYSGLEDAPVYGGHSPQEVEAWFNEALPEEGMTMEELLTLVKAKVLDPATLNIGPHMYAYVMAGGTQVSMVAEQLATAVNQNVGKWHLAPSMTELEKRVAQWGSDFIGYGANAGGVLVSGGSAANLTGLTVARNLFFEQQGIRQKGLAGMKPPTVYASEEVHNCVDKSVEQLGIGTDHLRKIATHDDFTIDLEALEQQIKDDLAAGYHPFCLVGNAGTVNTGAIDPLDTLADLAKAYGLWYHVDGAYGALAASVEAVRPLYKGIARADSVALDYHKWLYQPYEAGLTLVRDREQLKRSYYTRASYLATDVANDGRMDMNDHYFQLSRNAKALKVWMSFKAYGAARLRAMIAKDIALTKYLAGRVEEAADFGLYHQPTLGVVCFRYLGPGGAQGADPDAVEHLNKAIVPALEADRRVFITGTRLKGQAVIRACLINHRLQERHIDHLLQVIREVGSKLPKP